MPSAHIVRRTDITRSARVLQVEGIFELPRATEAQREWDVELPLDEQEWSIGAIIGPSGSGKSTVLNELFADDIQRVEWSASRALVDDFPPDVGIRDVTRALSSVGLSSPPSWLKPFAVLSNGEQFRATLARLLVHDRPCVAIDEFTSVVDRNVAKIGSAAVAKAVRRGGRRLVVASCHYDILEWLQPDWVLNMRDVSFAWRSVQPRPDISLVVRREDRSLWRLFRHHHYLNTNLNKAAKCFVAWYERMPVAFCAVLPFPHRSASGWREHRLVTLPDYQGVGIGTALSECVASAYSVSKPYRVVTSHPAVVIARDRSKAWKCVRKPSMVAKMGRSSGIVGMRKTCSTSRLTASFEYTGARDVERAAMWGLPTEYRR